MEIQQLCHSCWDPYNLVVERRLPQIKLILPVKNKEDGALCCVTMSFILLSDLNLYHNFVSREPLLHVPIYITGEVLQKAGSEQIRKTGKSLRLVSLV